MRTANVIVAIGVTGALLFATGVLVIVSYCCLEIANRPRTNAIVGKRIAPKVWGREEFRAAVTGKSSREIIETVGRPSSTQDHGNGDGNWYYVNLTRDPVTGRIDGDVQIVLQQGVAVKVNY